MTSLSPRRATTPPPFPVNRQPSWSHHCCSLLPGRKQKLFTTHRCCVCLEPCWEMPRPAVPAAAAPGTDGGRPRAVFSGLSLPRGRDGTCSSLLPPCLNDDMSLLWSALGSPGPPQPLTQLLGTHTPSVTFRRIGDKAGRWIPPTVHVAPWALQPDQLLAQPPLQGGLPGVGLGVPCRVGRRQGLWGNGPGAQH